MSESTTGTVMLPISQIHCDDDFNCRGSLAPIDVVDLAKDIEQQAQIAIRTGDQNTTGLLNPVIVMEYSLEDQQRTGFKYLLISGYRRTKAFLVLKRDVIPAFIKPQMTSAEAQLINLSENVHRKELNILQEARVLSKLIRLGIGEEECALRIGRSRGWVQERALLLKLPTDIQEEIGAGIIPQKYVRSLYSIHKANPSNTKKVYEAAKKAKSAKQNGTARSLDLNPKRNVLTHKCIRKKWEIFDMQDQIRKVFGNNIASRALAWAAGEITTAELYVTFKDYADENGIPYEIPTGEEEQYTYN